MKLALYLSLVISMTALFLGCSKLENFNEINEIQYNAEFAVPLIDAQLSIDDILENFEDNSTLTIDPNGLLRFKYSGDVITKTSDEVFEQITELIDQFPIIPIVDTIQALPFSNPEGLDMDRLDIKGGFFTYAVENDQLEPINFVLEVPQALKDGETLRFEVDMPAWDGEGAKPVVNLALNPFPMSGYRIVPEDDLVFIRYEATTESGERVKLSTVFISLIDFEFSYAEGYLGNQVYEGGRDTIEIDFFESWIQGEVYFEEPIITFFFENSFGLPTRSVVNVFDILTAEGEILKLESEFLTTGIDFPYPGLDEVGEIKDNKFIFTKENSNIDIVLGSSPVAVDYDVNAVTNPDELTDIRGFITDSSFYRVNVEVELPLYGKASNFVARDTFEITLDEFDDVSSAEFKVVGENGLPLEIDVQGYFLDEQGEIIDSLFMNTERVLEGAPVDGDGFVNGTSKTTLFVDYDGDRFEEIRGSKNIAVVATFSTSGNGENSVNLQSNQNTNIRIGAKIRTGN